MRIQILRIFMALLLFTFSTQGFAATESEKQEGEEHRGQGYAFYAPGALGADGHYLATAHIGGGGEVLLYRGLGVGGEIGYLTPQRDFAAGIGMLSANGSYHFNQAGRLSPFVTAGWTLGIRDGHTTLFNYGGGVNYWFRERVGLRLEFRDHVKHESHFLGARIGLSFR
jgi:hypothetical protein